MTFYASACRINTLSIFDQRQVVTLALNYREALVQCKCCERSVGVDEEQHKVVGASLEDEKTGQKQPRLFSSCYMPAANFSSLKAITSP